MRFYLTFAYAHCSSSRISLPLLLPVRPLPIRLLCYCCPVHSMDPSTPWHSFRDFLFILPIVSFAATCCLSPCFHFIFPDPCSHAPCLTITSYSPPCLCLLYSLGPSFT